MSHPGEFAARIVVQLSAVANLSERQVVAVEERFGLYGPPRTLKYLAAKFGVCVELIRFDLCRAGRKMHCAAGVGRYEWFDRLYDQLDDLRRERVRKNHTPLKTEEDDHGICCSADRAQVPVAKGTR